jgi:hypothetical protein
VPVIRIGQRCRGYRVSNWSVSRVAPRTPVLLAAVAAVTSLIALSPSSALASAAPGGVRATRCSVTVNGPPVTMKVSRPGASAKCTFTAKAGQRVTEAVTKLVTSDGSNCATVTLLTPNGITVDSSLNCNSVGVGPDALTVPAPTRSG